MSRGLTTLRTGRVWEQTQCPEREQHVQRPCGGREHSVSDGQRGSSGCWSAARREKWVMGLEEENLPKVKHGFVSLAEDCHLILVGRVSLKGFSIEN